MTKVSKIVNAVVAVGGVLASYFAYKTLKKSKSGGKAPVSTAGVKSPIPPPPPPIDPYLKKNYPGSPNFRVKE